MHHSRSFVALLASIGALTTAFVLPACGGGGGGASPTADAATADTTPAVDGAPSPGDAASSCGGGACPRVSALAIGYQFTLALVEGGVRCWGRNGSGQCGDGTTTPRPRPVRVEGLDGVTQIAAGAEHACALRNDGTVWCWGSGAHGRLGNGGTDNALRPSPVMGVTGATHIAVGFAHGCAVVAGGAVRCWGRGGDIGARASSMTAAAVPNLTGVVELAASAPATFGGSVGPFTCARRGDGTVACWGSNDSGQLAVGTTDNMPLSTEPVAARVTGARRLVVGGAHACVLTAEGVRCWGNNLNLQLGDGTQESRAAPVAAASLMGARDLVLGRDVTCGLFEDGSARCLGANGSGQLGRGARSPIGTAGEAMAAPVAGLGRVVALAVGEDHACAATADGATHCWGANAFGQLGVGMDGDARFMPTAVVW